jgi:homospermidine synthase
VRQPEGRVPVGSPLAGRERLFLEDLDRDDPQQFTNVLFT